MPTVDEILQLARRLPPEQQREIAWALMSPAGRASASSGELPMTSLPAGPRPHSVAWVKAERGHAVLATDTAPSEAELPQGPAALAGIWADRNDVGARDAEGR